MCVGVIKGVKKKMSLDQNLKSLFLKNRKSYEAVLLTVCVCFVLFLLVLNKCHNKMDLSPPLSWLPTETRTYGGGLPPI